MRLALVLVVLAVVAMLVASRLRAAARAIPAQPPLQLDRANREVNFTATVQAAAESLDHVVVSKDSAQAASALFVSDSTDEAVLAAFAALEPGHDAGGEAVDLLVQWAGSGGRHSMADMLALAHPRSPRLDFRLPGNARLDASDAGCIVRVASSSHPNIQGTVANSIADGLPRPGTAVVLTLKSRMEEA